MERAGRRCRSKSGSKSWNSAAGATVLAAEMVPTRGCRRQVVAVHPLYPHAAGQAGRDAASSHL